MVDQDYCDGHRMKDCSAKRYACFDAPSLSSPVDDSSEERQRGWTIIEQHAQDFIDNLHEMFEQDSEGFGLARFETEL